MNISTAKSDKISALQQVFSKGGTFFLLGHKEPDGDCIGSLSGLYYLLQSQNKTVDMAVYEKIPLQYQLVTEDIEEDILMYSEDIKLSEYDIVMVSDCSDLGRLGPARKTVENLLEKETTVINIDHHDDNSHFGNYNLVIPEAAATGEIIYDLAQEWRWKISRPAARALALAILSDTGFFRYSNTTTEVMEKVLKLMEMGVDIYRINRSLYGRKQPRVLKLQGKALASLKLASQGDIAYLQITREDYKSTNTIPQDKEGIVNYARDVEGVEVGILFSEEKDGIKVSFRSNNYLPVNDIARKFGGGGHLRAAGCKVNGDLEQVINDVIAVVKKNV